MQPLRAEMESPASQAMKQPEVRQPESQALVPALVLPQAQVLQAGALRQAPERRLANLMRPEYQLVPVQTMVRPV
jgi:hypothetical protein